MTSTPPFGPDHEPPSFGFPPTGGGMVPSGPGHYPRQPLTEQHVQPGRSHRRLYAVAAVLVVVLIAALVTLRVLHDQGEKGRDAYCAALRTATRQGDVARALSEPVVSVPDVLRHLRDLAPGAVAGQWDDLYSIVSKARIGRGDPGEAARLFIDVTAIADDAQSNCGLTMHF